MVAAALILFLSAVFFVTAFCAWYMYGKENSDGSLLAGLLCSISGGLVMVSSLALMHDAAPRESPVGYGARFSDTTWTPVVIISADSAKVRFFDLVSVKVEPYRAVFYEMSPKSFAGNAVETLVSRTIRSVRVLKSPDKGLSHIEVR